MTNGEELGPLMEALGHRFGRPELLAEALTHASYRNEHPDEGLDNERLEFLGDAILGAAMSHLLFEAFPEATEGVLTRYKAVLVSEQGLAETAAELDLGRYLRLGRGEDLSGGRDKPSVLSDATEAVVAAVYLDGGFEAVRSLLRRVYAARIEEVGRAEAHVDFKTKLQELIQQTHGVVPVYAIVETAGPAHDRTFTAEVRIQDEDAGTGRGRSKKEAQQAAARSAYRRLTGAGR